MKIPDGAKVISESRLTGIRIVSTLYDRHINAENIGHKDLVKAAMRKKGVNYAESDHVIARLHNSNRMQLDARKVHALIKAGKITADDFFDACIIRREPLAAKLSGDQLAELSTPTPASPSLITEFKPGVQIDCQELTYLLAQSMQRSAAA